MKVAVTGATGFLGRAITLRLVAAGHDVVALVRDPATASHTLPGVRTAPCRLPDGLDETALAGAEVVVHAAWATTETDAARADPVNEDGTRRVVDAAHRAGARVVFISSIAARPDAPSRYGRAKWAMERLMDPARDAVLRPGLVIGPGASGLFAQLSRAAARLHVVPVFAGGRQPLQIVHVAEVADAVLRIATGGLAGTFVLAEPDPVDLATFLRLMTREMGVRCIFVPLPLRPVLAAVRLAERLGVGLPLRSESLLGMQGMQRVEVADSLARLGMAVRPARESIRECGLARRAPRFVLALVLLVLVGAPTRAEEHPMMATSAADTRQPLPLLATMAEHQKRNMREHLAAVQAIIAAVSRDDMDAVAKAAAPIGYSEAMGQMCGHMGAAAPGFTAMALDFHRTADAIGDAARRGDRAGVLSAVDRTLQACVGCHATYRQEIVDEETWKKLTAAATSRP